MTDRINTRILLYVLLVAALVWEIFNFGWIAHVFVHPELHPHPFEDHQFVVDSTTILMVVLLIFSLVMYKRKLAGATNSNGKTFSEQSIDAIPDFISIHDSDFRIIKINKALAEYLGETPDKICGRYCYEIFHNSSKPHDSCPHKNALALEEAVVEEIFDTELGALRISCTPLHGRDGNLKGTIHHARPLLDNEDGDQVDEDGIRMFEELILDLKSKDFIMMMCAGCSKYRDENNEWQKIATFFLEKTSIKLSHGICPDCTKRLYPDFIDDLES